MLNPFKKKEAKESPSLLSMMLSYKPMIEMATGKKLDSVIPEMLASFKELKELLGLELMYTITLDGDSMMISIYTLDDSQNATLHCSKSISRLEDVDAVLEMIANFSNTIKNQENAPQPIAEIGIAESGSEPIATANNRESGTAE